MERMERFLTRHRRATVQRLDAGAAGAAAQDDGVVDYEVAGGRDEKASPRKRVRKSSGSSFTGGRLASRRRLREIKNSSVGPPTDAWDGGAQAPAVSQSHTGEVAVKRKASWTSRLSGLFRRTQTPPRTPPHADAAPATSTPDDVEPFA